MGRRRGAHSERGGGAVNEMDNKQRHAIMLAAGLNPIVCGGVTLYVHAVDYLEYQQMPLADQMTMCALIANAWRMNRMVEND